MFSYLQEMCISESPTNRAAITPEGDGFSLADADGLQSVEWVHVAEIVAYRRDPVGDDLLCLAFRVGREGRYVEVNEEMTGYEALLESLYEAFPEISPTWWQDVTAGLGPNRVTLYGLPAGETEQPSPAERYLREIDQRKAHTRADWMRIGWACAGVWAAAGVQTFFAWWLGGWSVLTAMSLLPLVLVIVVARFVRRPGAFFLLLAGFYLAEALWAVILGRWGTCLIGKLLEGRFSCLLLPGVEILLAMAVMLLFNRRSKRSKRR